MVKATGLFLFKQDNVTKHTGATAAHISRILRLEYRLQMKIHIKLAQYMFKNLAKPLKECH